MTKQRFDAYWGIDRITHFYGTKKAIISRLDAILDINWLDTLIVTEDGNFDNQIVNAGEGVYNDFFTKEEWDKLVPNSYEDENVQ